MTRLFLGVVFLIGILAAVALGLPSHVTVTRSVVINAPESAIFPYLNNLHRFSDWSPWAVRDPQLSVSYSGPQEGQGAKIQWASKVPSVGTGSMEITESKPNNYVGLVVNFNGLDGTSSYEIKPEGSGSKVSWNFGFDSGTSPLKRWKALMLDGFIGAEYRTGLDRLKEKIESERRPTEPTISVAPEGGISTQPEQPAAALPPGAAPQGTTVPQTTTVPQGAATGAAAPEASDQPDGAAPAATETTEPAPEPAPPPKKKKRRQ
jgi:hypothetical protein